MIVRIAGGDLDNGEYDSVGDVLYLHVGDQSSPPARQLFVRCPDTWVPRRLRSASKKRLPNVRTTS